MKKTKVKEPQILAVEILEAKENPLFTEEMRQAVRFLRYNQAIPCVECGKKRRIMWTMLCQFKAADTSGMSFSLKMGQSRAPLTPVCSDHPMAPDWPEKEKKISGQA